MVEDTGHCKNVTHWHTQQPGVERVYFGVFQVVFPVLILVGGVTNLVNLAVLTRPTMRTKPYR